MSKEVRITRQRTIEEVAATSVEAANPNDAVAAAHHLIDGQKVKWKYNRTIETGDEVITVKEVKEAKS
jgi:hypothetical protein